MNIYLVERLDNTDYDEFSDFVVIASSQQEALRVLPSTNTLDDTIHFLGYFANYDWVKDTDKLKVTLLETADPIFTKTTVVTSSYHAG